MERTAFVSVYVQLFQELVGVVAEPVLLHERQVCANCSVTLAS